MGASEAAGSLRASGENDLAVGGGATGFGAGHAESAACVAASFEDESGAGGSTESPSFSTESGATGGPATRSAWVSCIDTAIL
jgi:hypothetical protein